MLRFDVLHQRATGVVVAHVGGCEMDIQGFDFLQESIEAFAA